MSFGERLYFDMTAEAKRLGRKLKVPEEFVAMADRTFADYTREAKKRPKAKGTGGGRERNPLFDALALSTGCLDLSQITHHAGKAIGIALAQIREVCPGVTVEEIQRRAAAYKKRWTDPRNLSSMALAKHWHEFGQSDEQRTRAALLDPYQERPGWKPFAAALYPGSDVDSRAWSDIPLDARTAILKAML